MSKSSMSHRRRASITVDVTLSPVFQTLYRKLLPIMAMTWGPVMLALKICFNSWDHRSIRIHHIVLGIAAVYTMYWSLHHVCETFRRLAWRDAVREEQARNRDTEGCNLIGQEANESTQTPRWLLDGPSYTSPFILWHTRTAHSLGSVLRLLRLGLWHFPKKIFLHALNVCTNSTVFVPEITDEQIVEILTETQLLMGMTMSTDGSEMTLAVPQDVIMKDYVENGPHGLAVTINIATKKVVYASQNGTDLLGQNTKVFGKLAVYINVVHAKAHVSCEKSAREILLHEVEALEPSSRFVVSLHQGLLFLKQCCSTPDCDPVLSSISKADIVAVFENDTYIHEFDKRKMQFRYYKFLMQAHSIVAKLVKKYEFPVSPGHLFNNIVTHSVDHHATDVVLSNVGASFTSMDGGNTLLGFVQGSIWACIWVPNDYNDLIQDEYIRDLKHPFYNELYQQLHKIDIEYADCLLASCSF